VKLEAMCFKQVNSPVTFMHCFFFKIVTVSLITVTCFVMCAGISCALHIFLCEYVVTVCMCCVLACSWSYISASLPIGDLPAHRWVNWLWWIGRQVQRHLCQ